MKQTVNLTMFQDAFRNMDRKENFSYYGLEALFNYLESLEEETGLEIELDVIALCCDYAEYTQQELIQDYGYMLEREEDQDDDDYIESLLEKLNDHTTVLTVTVDNEFMEDNGKITYIVQSF